MKNEKIQRRLKIFFYESTSDADSKYIILFIMKTYKVTYNAVFKNYENLNFSKVDQYAC